MACVGLQDAWGKGVSNAFLPLTTDFDFPFLRRGSGRMNTTPVSLSRLFPPFFRRRTSVPVSRGLGRQREIACFGGSVDTLTRNIMIFSKDITVYVQLDSIDE